MSKQSAAELLKKVTRQRQLIAGNWEEKRNSDVSNLLATTLPALFNIDRFGLFVLTAKVTSDKSLPHGGAMVPSL